MYAIARLNFSDLAYHNTPFQTDVDLIYDQTVALPCMNSSSLKAMCSMNMADNKSHKYGEQYWHEHWR